MGKGKRGDRGFDPPRIKHTHRMIQHPAADDAIVEVESDIEFPVNRAARRAGIVGVTTVPEGQVLAILHYHDGSYGKVPMDVDGAEIIKEAVRRYANGMLDEPPSVPTVKGVKRIVKVDIVGTDE